MQSSEVGSGVAYGPADRLLHRLALSSSVVLETSFDIERARWGKASRDIPVLAPVFVCGLARAGTTILMQLLHDSGSFASLTYRDLPFPLAPNTWRRLAPRSRSVDRVARGHDDGLEHDLDTPEAIEEVFWRCFEGEYFRRASELVHVEPQPETIERFHDYLKLIALRYGKSRYLSKNNNNILRIGALVKGFPDARLVHPFREPAQHAASLRLQHRRACQLAGLDSFRKRYMQWLGHHEFGADHKPFALRDRPQTAYGADDLNYWLAIWIGVYSHLLSAPPAVGERQIFVDYDSLCEDPEAQTARLAHATALGSAGTMGNALRAPRFHDVSGLDAALLEQAYAIWHRLKARSAA